MARKLNEAEKAHRSIERFYTPERVTFVGGSAYIDKRGGIEVFAYLHKWERAEIVNGIVPVRVPRKVILDYLKNFPAAK